jgi:hypothetical protein
MTKPALFAFAEPEHLTRISLKLRLEDIGFVVEEDGDGLAIAGARAFAPAALHPLTVPLPAPAEQATIDAPMVPREVPAVP